MDFHGRLNGFIFIYNLLLLSPQYRLSPSHGPLTYIFVKLSTYSLITVILYFELYFQFVYEFLTLYMKNSVYIRPKIKSIDIIEPSFLVYLYLHKIL